MGKKHHKYANASVTVQTSLTGDQVADIVRRIADSTKGLTVETVAPGGLGLKFKSWAKVTQMTFDVRWEQLPEGTRVETEILYYLMEQSSFMFIPLGPKTMVAWKSYKRFMGTLAGALQAADPAARSTIVEIPVAV